MARAVSECKVEEARSAIFDVLDEFLGPFITKRLTDELLDEVIAAGFISLFDETQEVA